MTQESGGLVEVGKGFANVIAFKKNSEYVEWMDEIEWKKKSI